MAAHTATSHTSRLEPIKSAVRRSGIPYGSLRDLVHRGEIPVIKIGRAWYLDRADLDNWISSRKELIAAR